MGALETARLMLASNDVRATGVGNETDQVGRNYLSHLCTTAGNITFSAKDAAYDYERDVDGIYLRRRLWLNEHAQRKLQLLNTTFRTHLPEPADPDSSTQRQTEVSTSASGRAMTPYCRRSESSSKRLPVGSSTQDVRRVSIAYTWEL